MQPKPAVGDGYLVARAQDGYLDGTVTLAVGCWEDGA
jgi:hypothetical protein